MIVTFGATAEEGVEGEREMINIERHSSLRCRHPNVCFMPEYLTVDVEKHSLAHSWWNLVFRNAEICAQESTIDAVEAQKFAFVRVAPQGSIVDAHQDWTAIVTAPRDSCSKGFLGRKTFHK
jgi:hypothetical protein